MWVGIVRSRRRFRVVLHCEDWKFMVPNTFHRSIVQINVSDLQARRAWNDPTFSLHRETMVL